MLSVSHSQRAELRARRSGLSRPLGSPFLPYLNKQIVLLEMLSHTGRIWSQRGGHNYTNTLQSYNNASNSGLKISRGIESTPSALVNHRSRVANNNYEFFWLID